MSASEEKRNQWVSLLTSVGIHFGLLVLFLFAVGWKAPDPPLSEYGSGVELNFGLDSEGSGDIQPVVPAGNDAVSPQREDKIEKKQPEETPAPPVDRVEPKADNPTLENSLTGQEDSPVEVKEAKKSKKVAVPPAKVKETKEVKDKPVRTDETKVTTIVKEDAVAKKSDAEGIKKAAGAKGEGDDKNKTGDKGSPEGTLDPNGQYTGKAGTGGLGGGGGNGFALQMAGWNWDSKPQAPKLPDNENGRIVFEIEVDADGEIVRITTLERGLSPEAEKICKQEIQKRSLVRTSNAAAPDRSKGLITFVLKTQ